MRKYQFLAMLASLTAIFLLSQSSPVLGESIFRGNCEGFAPYTMGEDMGVYISCSADRTSWSIRWSGDTGRQANLANRAYIISGDIRAKQITNVVEYSFDTTDGQFDSSNLRTGTNKDILSFYNFVADGEDGLDFDVTGRRVLFSLDGNLLSSWSGSSGSYTLTPSDIFIGADGSHPESVNFGIIIP